MTENAYLGDDELRLKGPPLESFGKEKVVWASFRVVDAPHHPAFGKSALTIEVSLNADKSLREAKIVDWEAQLTFKFDSSCKLVHDEWLLKHPEHMETAKKYEQKLAKLLFDIGAVHKPAMSEPPDKLFRPRAMKDQEQKPKVKHFEETVKIQCSPTSGYSLNIPSRVEDEMGFKKGGQVKVGFDREHIIIEPVSETRYVSKVWESGGSLMVTIPSNLQDRIESEKGNGIMWSLPDASTGWKTGREHGSLAMLIPSEAAEEKGIRLGGQVEWVIRGRALSIEPVLSREEGHFSTISEAKTGLYSYARRLQVYIPREISKKFDGKIWGKGVEVGFEVVYDEPKKLVITPKQA
jgi:antitoxin component of MazEF toxin-antitoxin module